MDVHRLGIKFFAADPASIHLEDFILIFHSWIQKQAVPGHLLIDVHDYSHVHNGPGILLVAHEGNFSMDLGEDRPGLFYYRKTPAALPAADQLALIVRSALQACRLIEAEASLRGSVRFRIDELLLIANDRLHAPNVEATLEELRPVLSAAIKEVLEKSGFTITRASTDPKDRLAIRATL